MAVQVRALQPRLFYLLTISGQAEELELVRWTIATGEVSSAFLPAEVTSLLQLRLTNLTRYIAAADLPDQGEVLGALMAVRVGSGLLTVSSAPGDGYHAVVLGEFEPGTTYSVFLSIPHTLGSPLC